MLLDTSQTTN